MGTTLNRFFGCYPHMNGIDCNLPLLDLPDHLDWLDYFFFLVDFYLLNFTCLALLSSLLFSLIWIVALLFIPLLCNVHATLIITFKQGLLLLPYTMILITPVDGFV